MTLGHWYIGEARHDCRARDPYSPDLAPADFFLLVNLKSTLKVCRFQMIEEIKENSHTGPSRNPAKHVPGRVPELEKTLGALYQQ